VNTRRASWRAIGTNVEVVLYGGDLSAGRAAVDRVVKAADAAFSRFRTDSELSRMQSRRGPVRVSPLLGRALEAALRGARLTDGLVDPTVGRVMRLVGYDVDFATVAARTNESPRFEIHSMAAWRALSWDHNREVVTIPPGVELDFGSTGKALISDLAAPAAGLESGAKGVLVGIGGDIATWGSAPVGGWRVLMAEDSTQTRTADSEVAVVTDGALATSSTTVRRWLGGQQVVHHLIDPRTSRPAEGPWRTASVVAATCVDANICSTAAIILGDEAEAWLDSRGVAARLVSRTGDVRYLGGWPPPVAGVA
jgi:thiamine biosynthesis lipoprotein